MLSIAVVVGLIVLLGGLLVWWLLQPVPLSESEKRLGLGRAASAGEYRLDPSLEPASALARSLLDLQTPYGEQAYRRVRHHTPEWPELVAGLHTNCCRRCSTEVERYFRRYPDIEAVRVLFPRLDPEDSRPAAVVFPRSSTSHQRRCRHVCRCDKSDEICPTGYHLQISEALLGEPKDSPLPKVTAPVS